MVFKVTGLFSGRIWNGPAPMFAMPFEKRMELVLPLFWIVKWCGTADAKSG